MLWVSTGNGEDGEEEVLVLGDGVAATDYGGVSSQAPNEEPEQGSARSSVAACTWVPAIKAVDACCANYDAIGAAEPTHH